MNWLNNYISQPLIDALGYSMLHSLWIGLIGAVLVYLLFLITPSKKSTFRFNASLVITLVYFCTIAGIFSSKYHELSTAMQFDLTAFETTATIRVDTTGITEQTETSQGQFFTELQQYNELLVLVWMLGVLALSIRFVGGLYYIKKLRTHSLITPSELWKNRLTNLSERLHLRKVPVLFESALVKSPIALGYLKPMILVPVGMLTNLPVAHMEAVLVHELIHFKFGDYLANICLSTMEILLFFNPATWWLTYMVRSEMENRCDDLAVAFTQNRMTYAQALIAVNEIGMYSSPSIVMTLAKNRSQLSTRIERLFNKQKNASMKFTKHLAAVLILFGTLSLLAFNKPIENELVTDPDPIYVVDGKVISKETFDEMRATQLLNGVAKLDQGDAVKQYGSQAGGGAYVFESVFPESLSNSAIIGEEEYTNAEPKDGTELIIKNDQIDHIVHKERTSRKTEITGHFIIRPVLNKIKFKNQSDSDPLIIINGQKTNQKIETISSENIKNLEVIKGPKAIKEYGEEAINGVVLITMKNAAEIEFDSSRKVESPDSVSKLRIGPGAHMNDIKVVGYGNLQSEPIQSKPSKLRFSSSLHEHKIDSPHFTIRSTKLKGLGKQNNEESSTFGIRSVETQEPEREKINIIYSVAEVNDGYLMKGNITDENYLPLNDYKYQLEDGAGKKVGENGEFSFIIEKGKSRIDFTNKRGKSVAGIILNPQNIEFKFTVRNGNVSLRRLEPQITTEKESIIIRSSNPDKEPLFVIDGEKVPNEFVSLIKPEDIESLSVLKGESAIKIYGDAGKDGVIIITTKDGNFKLEDHIIEVPDEKLIIEEIKEEPTPEEPKEVIVEFVEEPTPLETFSVYPNPSNDIVAVTFNLPKKDNVVVDVWSLDGKKALKNLHIGELTKGAHKFEWDASEQKAGIYIIQLKTPEKTLTKRVVLK